MPSLIPTPDPEKEALNSRFNRLDQLEKNPAFIWFIEKVKEKQKIALDSLLATETDIMKYPVLKSKYHILHDILDIIPLEKRVVTQLLKDQQNVQLTDNN